MSNLISILFYIFHFIYFKCSSILVPCLPFSFFFSLVCNSFSSIYFSKASKSSLYFLKKEEFFGAGQVSQFIKTVFFKRDLLGLCCQSNRCLNKFFHHGLYLQVENFLIEHVCVHYSQ